MSKNKNREKSFTLIELLVVIAIIGILASIVFVSVSGVRKKAKRAAALQSFKQITQAMYMYYNGYGDWPNPEPYNPGSYYFEELEPGDQPYDRPDFVPEFYATWDATYYCSTCRYTFRISDWDGDKKPDCGYIQIYNFDDPPIYIYKYTICLTDICGSDCNYWNYYPE
ncbi:type II secretion system GspH family protein [Patescibacteria group bacterium]|nr:type II secretion system GspH family protein [Patescibacteria group bacterium]MCG2700383.1 type II secretion system GspH family protein [Candidatus Parcubacteria bacterium]